MFKKIWGYIFKVKEGKDKVTETLTIRERLVAFKNLPLFFKLVWQTSPWLTFFNGFLRISQSLLPVGLLYTGKLIIDQVVLLTRNGNESLSHAHLWRLIALEFGLVVTMTALGKIIIFIDNSLGELLTYRTSVMIMKKAATLDLDQFEDAEFYDKLERARQQTNGRAALLSQVFSQFQDVITIGFLAGGLVLFNPWLIFVLLISIIPSFLGEAYFNAKNYNLIRTQTHGRREMEYISFIGSSDESAKEVRIFDLSDFFVSRFLKISNRFYRATRNLEMKRSVLGTILSLPGSIGFYIAFIFIIKGVLSGTLSIGDLTFLIGSIRQLAGISQNVMKRISVVAKGALYLRDFFDFFKIQPKIRPAKNPRPFPKPVKQGFTFENVGFKYLNSNNWANRYLNFTLHAGEKLALVGENGAGKTTLVKLLVRLYEPTEGRILLDGHDLREYDLAELRGEIGIIFQDYLRYQMTTAENIAMGNIKEKDNHELIINSAKKSLANLIVERFPGKYDQMLGRRFKNGVELSGGEWQKIALARAYMRDAQLVILDEPTAALDARAEYEVFERFAELTKDKAAMLISHRFSTVRMANRILVLEKGEIIELGSHEELLAKGGRYAELFQLQAMGYR
ncbi:MAG: ABC transporter ATP-binding protein [Ferruginibacter sp.]|nr:ABC transporter ATP-binding protein [Ferruginibacter sp.]